MVIAEASEGSAVQWTVVGCDATSEKRQHANAARSTPMATSFAKKRTGCTCAPGRVWWRGRGRGAGATTTKSAAVSMSVSVVQTPGDRQKQLGDMAAWATAGHARSCVEVCDRLPMRVNARGAGD